MPSIVIPPGYAQLVHRFAVTGDPEEQVFTLGVELGSVVDPDDVAALGYAAFDEGFDDGFYSTGSTMVGVTAYLGNDGDTLVGEYIANNVGQNAGAMLPTNCALLIRKRTDLAGRRGRGRMYLPSCFLPEGNVSMTGVIDSGVLAGRQTCADDWYDGLVGGDPARFANAVVFHTTPSVAPTVITQFTVEGTIATQRQRLRK